VGYRLLPPIHTCEDEEPAIRRKILQQATIVICSTTADEGKEALKHGGNRRRTWEQGPW